MEDQPVPPPADPPAAHSFGFHNLEELFDFMDKDHPAASTIWVSDNQYIMTHELHTALVRAHAEGRFAARRPEHGFQGPSVRTIADSVERDILWHFWQQGYSYTEELIIATQPTAGPSRSRVPKVADPQPYEGSKDKFRDFVTQLQLKFRSDPTVFANDAAKIAYAASYLKGTAYQWFASHIDEETGEIDVTEFSEFVKILRAAWADPDAVATAERKVRDLKQKSSTVSVYYAKFVEYMAVCGWDEKAQLSHFMIGLCDEVKDLMITHDRPKKLDDAYKLALRLDNAWRARQAEKRGKTHTPDKPAQHQKGHQDGQSKKADKPSGSNSSTPSTAYGSHPGPMDLSASRAVSPETRKYRRENNLCLYCGEAGHYASNCPNKGKKGKKAKANKAEAAPAAASESKSESKSAEASVLYTTEKPKN